MKTMVLNIMLILTLYLRVNKFFHLIIILNLNALILLYIMLKNNLVKIYQLNIG